MNTSWIEYGLEHWVIFVATAILVVYPLGRILGRMGFAPLLSVIVVVPILNLLALWILAFIEWPNGSGNETAPPGRRIET